MLLDLDVVNMKFESINSNNFADVARIYKEGILTGMATFETDIPTWDKWDGAHMNFGRISIYEDGRMLGWAALTPVSDRCVYGGVAEVSVYVSQLSRGKGIGKMLLKRLVKISEENQIWTLQSGIFKENTASIVLHEKCGFRVIGYREKIGKLHGEWKDNVLMERRSNIIGV